MYRARSWMAFLAALFLVLGASSLEAQWVMVARAAKNRIQRMTQKSGSEGYDVATVILEATPVRVYDKALKTLKAHPEITITQDDSNAGKIQFRKGQQIAGLQISQLGDNLSQLVIASSISTTAQQSTTSLVVDAVLRVCKEVNVECTVQAD